MGRRPQRCSRALIPPRRGTSPVEAAEGSSRWNGAFRVVAPVIGRHWEEVCAVHVVWSAAVQACRDSLRRPTLADLVEADERLVAGVSVVPGLASRKAHSGATLRPLR